MAARVRTAGEVLGLSLGCLTPAIAKQATATPACPPCALYRYATAANAQMHADCMHEVGCADEGARARRARR
jgi:hypothetical protein